MGFNKLREDYFLEHRLKMNEQNVNLNSYIIKSLSLSRRCHCVWQGKHCADISNAREKIYDAQFSAEDLWRVPIGPSSLRYFAYSG